MQVKITQTSDWDYREYREMNTLEELVQFMRDNHGSLVLMDCPESDSVEFEIEIYDTWRE